MTHKISTFALASFSFFFMTGFGEKHSSLETRVEFKDKKIELQFIVKPDKGMMISNEAPWTVQLKNTQGLQLALKDGKFESKDFDEKLPGFLLKVDPQDKVNSGKFDYVVKAFVCTEDKKHCYPQQHKGSLDWKKD